MNLNINIKRPPPGSEIVLRLLYYIPNKMEYKNKRKYKPNLSYKVTLN